MAMATSKSGPPNLGGPSARAARVVADLAIRQARTIRPNKPHNGMSQAYQWARQQGWVGVMTAWQLDFDRGELDAFRIAGKPAYGALAAMPK